MRRILRIQEVSNTTGLSSSSIYKQIREGKFPHSVNITKRAKGWSEYEVDILNQARIAGKSEQEIRDLVLQLHAERTGGDV